MTLTAEPTIPPIHPELLEKLLLSLTVSPFTEKSTVYHIGYAQAQRDFRYILEFHLNQPLPHQLPKVAEENVVAKRWWER